MSKSDIAIEEKVKVDVKPPSMFNVIFINDQVTPMDLVIHLLVNVFHHELKTAEQLTLEVHNKGQAIVGTYSYEVAETLSLEATSIARANGSPLKIQVVEEWVIYEVE